MPAAYASALPEQDPGFSAANDPALSLRQALLLAALACACEEDPVLEERLHELLDMKALERAADAFLRDRDADTHPERFREEVLRYTKAVFFEFVRQVGGRVIPAGTVQKHV